jgi:hypothetical protein
MRGTAKRQMVSRESNKAGPFWTMSQIWERAMYNIKYQFELLQKGEKLDVLTLRRLEGEGYIYERGPRQAPMVKKSSYLSVFRIRADSLSIGNSRAIGVGKSDLLYKRGQPQAGPSGNPHYMSIAKNPAESVLRRTVCRYLVSSEQDFTHLFTDNLAFARMMRSRPDLLAS